MSKLFSRRRLLAGLGAGGIASVGGLALSTEAAKAYPNSDSLASTPLRYDWRETYNGTVVDGGTTVTGTDAGPRIAITDTVPGDWGTLSIRLQLADDAPSGDGVRPFVTLDLTATPENGINDAESHLDDSPNQGELQEFLTVSLWYDTGTMGIDAFGAENGIKDVGERLVHPDASGTLPSVAAVLSTPTLLDPGEADPGGDSCLSGDDSLGFVLGWKFDADAGPNDVNVTQSDGVAFDLGLTIEDCD
ncbi:hypothetical protein [Haloarchaeobius litoreus]|uniref:SipW-cognate class signal peptide n=1 Tax=Haloarchaeobius litoreus TaxID=755306 RepID=A0ABD6DG42_9EURY|nr:hypothetical protein [Haloarchaeobius litoreus]